MKVSITAVAVLGGLAQYAQAAPIDILVISSSSVNSNGEIVRSSGILPIRIGHAGAQATQPEGVPLIRLVPNHPSSDHQPEKHDFPVMSSDGVPTPIAMKRPCGRGKQSFAATMHRVGNQLREMFGLPPVEYHHPRHRHKMIRFAIGPNGEHRLIEEHGGHRPHRHHNLHHAHHRHSETPKTFSLRLEKALMNLSHFEATAIAFVFGCGLGALFRLLIVFGILIFRGRQCRARQNVTSVPAALAAPPNYQALPAYADEKAVLKAEIPEAAVDEPTI